jgi:hypothetical protein
MARRVRAQPGRVFGTRSDYAFRSHWRVPGTVAEVLDVLADATTLPRWWPSVYLDVRVLLRGTPDGVGASAEVLTKGWLPYTLRWRLTVTEPVTPGGFAVSAVGDLNGEGRWSFVQDGPEVEITYDWNVSAAKPLLRRLSWILKPAFAANHRWAMARGEESLKLELRRRRERDPYAGERIPAPRGPTFARAPRGNAPI